MHRPRTAIASAAQVAARRRGSGQVGYLCAACLVIALCLLTSCGSRESPRGHIVVASTESAEQMVLGKMLVLLLQDAGYAVDDSTGLGDSWIVRSALEAGSVDVCWQYTGETWTTHLGHDVPISSAEEAHQRVRQEDALHQITWLAMAPYQHTMAILMPAEEALLLRAPRLTALAAYIRAQNPALRICTPADVWRSPQGLRGLDRVYRLDFRLENVKRMPLAEGYEALVRDECDCAVGYLADAELQLAGRGTVVALEDDRGFFQASSLAPVVRTAVLQEHPDLEPKLATLSRELTHEAMLEIKGRAAQRGARPDAIARSFLRRVGLLKRWQPFAFPTETPTWLEPESK